MKLFRLLLHLYPRDFLREYGDDIERDAAERGDWKSATWDIVSTAPREHLDQWRATLRQAWRGLRRTPGFSLVALATLAAGIGLNTAIFSIVYGVLLKPLPYPEPERLFTVTEATPSQQIRFALGPDFGSWREQSRLAQAVAGYASWSLPLYEGPDGVAPVNASWVTPELMSILGVPPERGRLLLAADDRPGAAPVALVSRRFLEQRLGGRAAGSIELDTVSYEVVGVLPAGFDFPAHTDVWLPFRVDFKAMRTLPQMILLHTLVRSRPGVTPEAMAAELSGIAEAGWNLPGVIGGYRNMTKGIRAQLTPLGDTVSGSARPQLLILMGGVALVLLIACLNVANLFVARAASRTREVAVRLALGAGPSRIARHVLAESLLLAAAGACLGGAAAYLLLRFLLALGAGTLPRAGEIAIDGPVLAVTAVTTLATGLLFGFSPLLFVRRVAVNEALKDGARGAGDPALPRFRAVLVASQLALSLVLLVGAGLLMRSFVALRSVDPGFDARGLLTLQTTVPPTAVLDFDRQALARLAALPGVTAVAMAPDLPMDGRFSGMAGLQAEGRPFDHKLPRIGERHINPGYFAALRIPIRQGRAFADEDFAPGSNRIVVNEALARSHFGTVDVVGRRMRALSDTSPWLTIIGVAANVRHLGLHSEPLPEYYSLYTLRPVQQMNFAIRVADGVDPQSLAGPAREALRGLNGRAGVHNLITMEDRIYGTLAQRRFQLWLLGAFALLALGLAGMGVYGVVSYLVAQRSHEIGVRMALGATRGNIVVMVMRHAWLLAAVGLGMGMAASYGAAQGIAKLLFAIEPTDPLSLAGAAIALLAVATLAAALPARRAAALDPVITLRRE